MLFQIIQRTTEEERAEFRVVHKNCQGNPVTFADESFIDNLFEGVFPEDYQVKVHLVCMHKGLKMMTPDGKLDVDVIKGKWAKHANGEHLSKLQQCLVEKSSPEETSWQFLKCQHNIRVALYGNY